MNDAVHNKEMEAAAIKPLEEAVREQNAGTEIPEYIPEKFRSADDPYKAMAESYSELEKKLAGGEPSGEETDKTVPPNEEGPEVEAKDDNKADDTGDDSEGDGQNSDGLLDFNKYFQEYSSDGQLSDESYQELEAKGIPQEVVDIYIDGYKGKVDAAVKQAHDITGGEETYNEMIAWAEENLSQEELNGYNRQVETDSELAVRGLFSKYQDSGQASIDRLRGGSKPDVRDANNPFKSQEEVTAAMSNPKYRTDPAYRKMVEARLMVSDNDAMGAVEHSHVSTTHQFGG